MISITPPHLRRPKDCGLRWPKREGQLASCPSLALDVRPWSSVHRHVLHRAGVAVENHVVWIPVDFLVTELVDVSVTDVRRSKGNRLNRNERGKLQPPGLGHLLCRLVFRDRYITLRGMGHLHAGDLAALDIDCSRVVALLVNDVMAV